MKKHLFSLVFAIILLIIPGCTAVKMITLPKDPLVFEKTTLKCETNNVAYDAINLGDRQYIVYAQFTDYYANMVETCIGYVETGSKTPEIYVCTIVGLDGDEYLMTVNAMTHGIPSIYREKNVEGILEYEGIEPCGYPIWDK